MSGTAISQLLDVHGLMDHNVRLGRDSDGVATQKSRLVQMKVPLTEAAVQGIADAVEDGVVNGKSLRARLSAAKVGIACLRHNQSEERGPQPPAEVTVNVNAQVNLAALSTEDLKRLKAMKAIALPSAPRPQLTGSRAGDLTAALPIPT
jgi:hypothetical protein